MIAGVLEIQMMANLARLSDDMRKAERVVSGSMDKVEKSIAHAKSAMQSLGMGLTIGLVADQLRRTVDTYTKLDAQLRLSTKSQQSYNTALADIRRISQIAQADISGTTMLYTRLMNVMDGTGVSQSKLATVTETVTFGLKAYGATSAEAASAALQLSQAMGANRLGGEEFRAVMEAMPNVMKVLAKSMGVSIGELRSLSIAGKITAAEMIKAWGDPAIAEQFKQYALRAQTITGAMTNVRNEITLLVGEFAKASGFTAGTIGAFNALAAAVRILAQYVDDLVAAFIIWATIVGAKAVSALVSARINMILLTDAHAEALAMNVALETSTREKILSDIASTQATISATAAKHESALAAVELSLAEQRAAIAQLNHARAAGVLSGHLYIVRTVEAELIVATNQLNAATAMRNSLMSRQSILTKDMIASNAALAASDTRLASAESLLTASTKGGMARIGALVGRAGWIGLILWGIYEIADYFGVIDAIFTGVEERAAKAAKAREGASLSTLEAEISNLQKLYDAQLALEKTRTGLGGAFAQATVGAFEMSSYQIKKLLDETKAAADATRKALLMSVANAPTWAPSEKWRKTLMTPAQAKQKKIDDLNELYFAEVNLAGRSQEAQLQLAKEYMVKLSMIKEKAGAAASASIMERMAIDLKAANDAEVSGKLNNVEKVNAAWAKFTEHRVADAQMLSDYEDALAQARIADRKNAARDITDSLMNAAKSGDFGKSILNDLQASFETRVIKVQIEAVVNNIMAGQMGPGLSMFGKFLGGAALVAAVLPVIERGLFGGKTVMGELRTVGALSRAGFRGRMEQSWERSGGLLRSGASGVIQTALSSAQQRTIDASSKSLLAVFNDLGTAIGDIGVRTRAFSVNINQAGDLTSALADGIGVGLVPALEEFRITGENLADTAKRMTTVFTTTTSLALSLGVSVQNAFGALGIASGDARLGLIDATGGIERFSQVTSSFIQNFLTDAEKIQPALDAVGRAFSELGIQGVTTKRQFADLVAAELRLGNYDVVGRLLGVSDAFNSIVASAEATQTALKNLLKTSSFENIVSYQRAMRSSSTPDISTQIAASTLNVAETLPAEKEANRAANKASALAQLNEAIAARDKAFMISSLLQADPGLENFILSPHILRVAQLQAIYDSIPAFATGGDHMGGLRLVGENGPELESTGPSRIYTAGQTRSMLSGNGGSDTVEEIRMLRQEAAAHAIALNTATQKLAKIADRWDIQGLPPERVAA